MPSPQSKSWSFTINSPTPEEEAHLETVDVQYIVWQIEGGTNIHIQGYVQLHTKCALRKVKETIGARGHFEISRGSPQQNTDYCTKLESRIRPGGCRGTMVTPGKRTDLSSFTEAIKSGANNAQLITDHLHEFYKYSRVVDTVRLAFREPRNWEMVVKVFYGESGTGKSHRAEAEAGDSRYFLSKGDKGQVTWWDGYNGQDSVIIDDFYGKPPSP